MKIKKSSDIFFKEINGEIVLLGKDKEKIHQLNQTGTFLWNNLEKTKSIKHLVQKLVEDYDIDQKTAANDVRQWITDLLDKGFIQKT